MDLFNCCFLLLSLFRVCSQTELQASPKTSVIVDHVVNVPRNEPNSRSGNIWSPYLSLIQGNMRNKLFALA